VADAVVIGSRLIQEIETSKPEEVNARVTAFLRAIREGMDRPTEVRP
jgi:tryptophan synthase alpha chain